jgi:hypothetical protein
LAITAIRSRCSLWHQVTPNPHQLTGLVTNVMVVRGGVVHTSGSGVLPGHVRGLVLEACRALGIPVVSHVMTTKDPLILFFGYNRVPSRLLSF